jgi:hypothetical protein
VGGLCQDGHSGGQGNTIRAFDKATPTKFRSRQMITLALKGTIVTPFRVTRIGAVNS